MVEFNEKEVRIRNVIDTEQNWLLYNPVLLRGEIGFAIKTGNQIAYKIGDGNTAWSNLPYSINTASEITAMVTNLQNQIDAIVTTSASGGDVAAEVAQSRVGADGTAYQTLKQRLDTEYNALTAEQTNLKEDLSEIDTRLSESITDIRKPFYGYGNLFFAERGTWDNHYYNDSGVLTPFNGYGYSELIPVKAKINYTIVAPPVFYNFLKEDGSYISGNHAVSGDSKTIATPTECAFLRISIPVQNKDTCMIVEGTIAPTSYIEPRYIINNEKTAMPYLGTDRPLNVYCIGDSLTEGVDYQTHVIKENYPYFLQKYLNVNIVNYGKMGLQPKTWWERWGKTLGFNQYTDVVLIMFGTNGGIPDTLDTDVEPFDDWHNYVSSICGCYCKLIEKIMEQSINKAQIILLTPPHNTYSQTQEYYVTSSYATIMKIAKRYAIPVIDVQNESGINKFNSSYFQPHDGLHFNAMGYHKLGSFIASKLKSLFSEYDFLDVYSDETQTT